MLLEWGCLRVLISGSSHESYQELRIADAKNKSSGTADAILMVLRLNYFLVLASLGSFVLCFNKYLCFGAQYFICDLLQF